MEELQLKSNNFASAIITTTKISYVFELKIQFWRHLKFNEEFLFILDYFDFFSLEKKDSKLFGNFWEFQIYW